MHMIIQMGQRTTIFVCSTSLLSFLVITSVFWLPYIDNNQSWVRKVILVGPFIFSFQFWLFTASFRPIGHSFIQKSFSYLADHDSSGIATVANDIVKSMLEPVDIFTFKNTFCSVGEVLNAFGATLAHSIGDMCPQVSLMSYLCLTVSLCMLLFFVLHGAGVMLCYNMQRGMDKKRRIKLAYRRRAISCFFAGSIIMTIGLIGFAGAAYVFQTYFKIGVTAAASNPGVFTLFVVASFGCILSYMPTYFLLKMKNREFSVVYDDMAFRPEDITNAPIDKY